MANDKFIWQQGDIEFVDEADFNKEATLYDLEGSKPFSTCALKKDCLLCDEEDQKIAVLLANKIYSSYFNDNKKDADLLGKVLKSYISLCQKLLPQEIVLTKELYCCAKMHFLNIFLLNHVFSLNEIKEISDKN